MVKVVSKVTKVFSLRFTKEDYDALEAMSKYNSRTVSNQIVAAVVEVLRDHELKQGSGSEPC